MALAATYPNADFRAFGEQFIDFVEELDSNRRLDLANTFINLGSKIELYASTSSNNSLVSTQSPSSHVLSESMRFIGESIRSGTFDTNNLHLTAQDFIAAGIETTGDFIIGVALVA